MTALDVAADVEWIDPAFQQADGHWVVVRNNGYGTKSGTSMASPHVAGVTHLFTLGWLTTTIFGALYQLLPVALAAPLRSTRLGHVSFWAFAPGAGLFACGVADGSTLLHHTGIGLIAVGIVLAVFNIGSSLPKSRSRDETWTAVGIALAFLLSTLVLGIVLLHNIHTGFLAEFRVTVLAIHLHVAIVGWALIMMVGVSHRLLPMFLLAHGADTRWTKRSLASLLVGVLALVTGLATGHAAIVWIGVAGKGQAPTSSSSSRSRSGALRRSSRFTSSSCAR